MKRLVILIVIVLLVAGGGGAAWWFLLREPPVDAAAAGEAGAEEEAETALRKRFVDLDPIVVPIIREGQVTLHLTLILTVELTKPMLVTDIDLIRRPLRDAIFTELHGIYALRYVQEKGYDLPIVRELLVRASQKVLGDGEVKAVLVRNIGSNVPQKS